MSWYSRFLVFIMLPIIILCMLEFFVNPPKVDQGDGNVPIVRAVQDG